MRGKSGNRSTLSNGFWSWGTCEVACEVTCEVAGLVMQNCSCTTHHLRYVIISLLLGPGLSSPPAQAHAASGPAGKFIRVGAATPVGAQAHKRVQKLTRTGNVQRC